MMACSLTVSPVRRFLLDLLELGLRPKPRSLTHRRHQQIGVQQIGAQRLAGLAIFGDDEPAGWRIELRRSATRAPAGRQTAEDRAEFLRPIRLSFAHICWRRPCVKLRGCGGRAPASSQPSAKPSTYCASVILTSSSQTAAPDFPAPLPPVSAHTPATAAGPTPAATNRRSRHTSFPPLFSRPSRISP